MVTGTINTTVVTLSRNIESTVVAVPRTMKKEPRVAPRALAGEDGDVAEEAGMLQQAHQDHHAQQQSQCVEVDGGQRLLLANRSP